MHCTRQITEDIYYVGGNDYKTDLFENVLNIHNGVTYNSYVILDEKTCLLDTADQVISRLFLENVEHVLNGRKLDYLVVHHMEPDHCYNIKEILLRYPEVKIVGNAKTFNFLHNFFPTLNIEEQKVVVNDLDTLNLGKHTLHFYFTPMVHWPEVMMSFEESEKILFSADAFGTFGTLNGNLFDDEINFERDYLSDARMYYSNIVGKYGLQVVSAFKKLPVSEIKMICPLHGPVLRSNLSYLIDKYQHWATYTPEEKGVLIVFGSMYGDNLEAAEILASKLSQKGVKNIKVFDAAKTDKDLLVSESFRVSNLVIISPTYNMTIYPPIDEYITDFMRMMLANRTITVIGNGSWAPVVGKLIKDKLATCKGFTYTPTDLTINSSLTEENVKVIDTIADEIKETLN